GCLQEGVAKESIAFAGHNGLDNLILIYDSNDVTLDAMADVTQGEDAQSYFKSQRWDAVTIDGQDLNEVAAAIAKAKADKNGRPKVIIAKTLIAKGIPEVAGTAKGHGEGGAKFIDSARAGLGLPADEHFFVSDEVRAHFADAKKKAVRGYKKWLKTFKAWEAANTEQAAVLASRGTAVAATELLAKIPAFP